MNMVPFYNFFKDTMNLDEIVGEALKNEIELGAKGKYEKGNNWGSWFGNKK